MHPYYTTNFADREMFAHNAKVKKQKEELNRILAHEKPVIHDLGE